MNYINLNLIRLNIFDIYSYKSIIQLKTPISIFDSYQLSNILGIQNKISMVDDSISQCPKQPLFDVMIFYSINSCFKNLKIGFLTTHKVCIKGQVNLRKALVLQHKLFVSSFYIINDLMSMRNVKVIFPIKLLKHLHTKKKRKNN